jgi:hypothetical protein
MKRTRSITLTALASSLALLIAVSAVAQTTPIRVDGKIIKSYITTMSLPEYQGRRTLTPGYDKISEWAAGKFKEWGLQPAGDNGTFFQAVLLVGARSALFWTTGTPELTINARKFNIADGDFTVDTWSTPGKPALGEVVFVGYGISAPAKGLDEYAGVNVKGKIVLAFTGSPQSAPAARGMGMGGPPAAAAPQAAPADPWADEAATAAKIKTAYDKGAAGILLYNPDPPVATTGSGGGAGGGGGAARLHEIEPSPYTRPFVVMPTINERVFRFVMSRDPQESVTSFTTRVSGIRRDIKAKKVRSAPTTMKAQVKAYDTVKVYGEKFKNNMSRNVIAKIEGSDPALKAQTVVLGGHLDHLGNRDGIVMNGADDDASGSAVVMEIARLMAVNTIKPKRTVIFALWCGEEQGLLGSNYFGEKPSAGVSMDLVVANFNMDMVGLGTRIGAPGAMNFPAIYDVIKRDQLPEVISVVDASQAGPGGSDYSTFITKGIEALALMTSGGVGHPDYHQAADDTDKIDPDILGKTGQFVLQGVLNVANETTVNLVIPDRLHIYNAQRMTIPDFSTFARGRFAVVAASTTDELLKLVNDRARELRAAARGQAAAAAAPPRRGRGGAGGGRFNLGVKDAGVFGGNVALIDTAATMLDIGRVDVTREDGEWFSNGLTEKGRAALRAMEVVGVVPNLVNPSPKVLGDVLDAAQKPFIVSGTVSLTPDIIRKMNAKNALLVVQCDPADATGCVARLEDTKKKLGDTDNILLSMSAGPALDEAKQTLYRALVKGGWTKDQIYAIAGNNAGTLGAQGNLTRLVPAPAGQGRGF